MKTPNQILDYISNVSFRSEFDWAGIESVSTLKYNVVLDGIAPKYDAIDGVTFGEFGEWYETGYGAGDIVWYNLELCILGLCTKDTARIAGKVHGNTIHIIGPSEIAPIKIKDVLPASKEDQKCTLALYDEQGLQFDAANKNIKEKYIPLIGDRVSFEGRGISGMGIMRTIDFHKNTFEMFCYSLYDKSKTTKYSMHEEFSGYTDFTVNPIGRNEYLQLGRRLNKYGKMWNDRLSRIEPIDFEVKDGEPYFYISETFKMVKCDEKRHGRKTADRKRGGNQFRNELDCLYILGQIQEIINNYLAK